MKIRKTGLALASGLLGCAVLPALAQQGGTGMRAVFGISQELEAGDNLALDFPEEGSTVLSTTTLSFDFLAETRTQQLSFGIDGKIREGRIPSGSDLQTGFVEPALRFAYSREAANARLTASANYRETDVSFFLPLSDFIDDTGVIVLPEDFEDLRGAGTREAYDAKIGFETGLNAPLGFTFDAGVNGISYSDTGTTSLTDIRRTNIGLGTRLRFSEVTTGEITYSQRTYEADDAVNTERDTDNLEFALTRDISEAATLTAGIGYSEIEERENDVVVLRENGLTGRLTYSRDLPNGTIGASYTATRDQNGLRDTLRMNRALDLPTGNLSFNIGTTRKEGGDPKLIGGVNWQNALPTGSIRLGLQRNVAVNAEDEERIVTTLDLGYTYEINALSSIRFNAAYGMTEQTATGQDTRRTDITLGYVYALTEDWNLNTGVAYRVRDEDTAGKSDSASVYVTIGRSFTLFQ